MAGPGLGHGYLSIEKCSSLSVKLNGMPSIELISEEISELGMRAVRSDAKESLCSEFDLVYLSSTGFLEVF